MSNAKITVQVSVQASVEKVWDYWTNPEHITKWNFASDDWHTPHSTNNLIAGGEFTSRMESKDGKMGFDFGGIYTEVIEYSVIKYVLGDGREVQINFQKQGENVLVTETFDAEKINSVELQRNGWQAILNNFKKYVEAN